MCISRSITVWLVVVFVIGSLVVLSIEFDAWWHETTPDVAIVVSKDETDSFALTMANPTLPMFLLIGMLDEYNVCVLYKGEEHCFNDKDLYEKVKVGDTVRIFIHKYFNKRGELKDTHIKLND